jgi:hypothetical protein
MGKIAAFVTLLPPGGKIPVDYPATLVGKSSFCGKMAIVASGMSEKWVQLQATPAG